METNLKNFKLLWITDPHLNFVHEEAIKSFCRKIKEKEPNAVVITGDIAEAPSIVSYLGFMDLNLENKCPIFFVLGNHDYYHGTIEGVREVMERLFTYDEASKMILEPRLGWLSSSGVVPLTEKTALIGHDGWYDGQYADWYKSKVYLNDYLLIGELADGLARLENFDLPRLTSWQKKPPKLSGTTCRKRSRRLSMFTWQLTFLHLGRIPHTRVKSLMMTGCLIFLQSIWAICFWKWLTIINTSKLPCCVATLTVEPTTKLRTIFAV